MKKILDFLRTNRYLIIWTVCYVFVTWAILYFMFGFSIFNGAQWHRLYHANLRGFPGFVFGILILACVPLYVATSILIIRSGKPLFTIPKPNIKLFNLSGNKKTTEQDKKKEVSATPSATDLEQIARKFPDEMRAAFAAAQNKLAEFETYTKQAAENAAQSASNNILMDTYNNTPTPQSPDATTDTTTDDFPIPSDFDISFDDTPGFQENMAPVFSEIRFDDDTQSPETDHTESMPDDDDDESGEDQSDVLFFLASKKTPFEIKDNIIITPTHAIATHTDPSFWVVDSENWFAAGKSKPSPVMAVLNAATEHNVTPALYLGADNIMDLDKFIPQWESDGITVTTDPESF